MTDNGQMELSDYRPDGPGIIATDIIRMAGQMLRIFNLMRDGQWRTLSQISMQTGASEAGASARLRDFRKPRNGGHTVNRRRVSGGLYEYQLIVSTDFSR